MEQIKKGQTYLCVEDVEWNGIMQFTKGNNYLSPCNNCLTNNSGRNHGCTSINWINEHFEPYTDPKQIKKGDQYICVGVNPHHELIRYTQNKIYTVSSVEKNVFHLSNDQDEDCVWLITSGIFKKHFKRHTEEENWRDLLDDQEEMLNFFPDDKPEPCDLKLPDYYNNEHGSLYLIAEQRGWNAWQQDIIKRVTRCENKGEFFSDLNKTKALIDLYIKEQGDKFKGDK